MAAFAALGHRGVDAQNPDVYIEHRGKAKRIGCRRCCVRRDNIKWLLRTIYREGDLLAAALFAFVLAGQRSAEWVADTALGPSGHLALAGIKRRTALK